MKAADVNFALEDAERPDGSMLFFESINTLFYLLTCKHEALSWSAPKITFVKLFASKELGWVLTYVFQENKMQFLWHSGYCNNEFAAAGATRYLEFQEQSRIL